MATNYQRGANFERDVVRNLEGYGYKALRSAGSHKPADVIALRVGETVAVQCKRDGRLPTDEWNKFWCWAALAGATPILASQAKEGRRNVIIYRRLESRKDGKGRQPLAPWEPQRLENHGNVS